MINVYDELLGWIVRGRIAPGSRLTELDIAERLDVSRTPAREAIRRLHAEGFLVPRRTGARTEFSVAPLTREDLEELYLSMAALESLAVARIDRITPAARRTLAADMRATNTRFQKAGRTRPGDYEALFTLHNTFHEQFVHACAGPRLRALIDAARPHVDRYEWVYAPYVGPNYEDTFAEHFDIVAAIREGSRRDAERAVRANWENGAARLTSALDRAGGRGDWIIA